MWKEGEGMAPLRVMGTGVLQRPSDDAANSN